MSKKRGLPDFKHCPPPPESIPKTPEGLADDILEEIAGLDVSEQNKVMEALNTKYAAKRHDEYVKAREQEKEAGANFERFMACAEGITEFIKARQAAKDLS